MSGSWEKPSGYLGFPIALGLWFSAVAYQFLIPAVGADYHHVLRTSEYLKFTHEGLIFVVEAEWALSTCIAILNNVYLLCQSNKKILKANKNHSKAKKLIICYQICILIKLCSLNREKTKFQSGTRVVLITKFVYLLNLRKSFL